MTEQVKVYPTLSLYVSRIESGGVREYVLPSCCFHDLMDESDEHLAGMGLAMLGNLIKVIGKDLYDQTLSAQLLLKRYPTDTGIECPFPGMPDDRPIPVDLTQLPFQTGMFLQDDTLKHRLDRWALMARVQEVWVPWLKRQMVAA